MRYNFFSNFSAPPLVELEKIKNTFIYKQKNLFTVLLLLKKKYYKNSHSF